TTLPPLVLVLFYNALPVLYIVEVVRPAIRSGGSKPMNEASAKMLPHANKRKWIGLGWLAVLAACSVFVGGLRAQSPGLAGISEAHSSSPTESAAPPSPSPNYALEERFLPDAVNKLVFDLAVTPHWFTLSDRFWYSYKTTEGTKYYIVDPLKKSKTLLWDNAKVAAALSTLTNFPYDAQNLPIKRMKLVEKDTRMRFEVEIRKNAVVPDEPKKEASQEDIEEQGKEGDTGMSGQQSQSASQAGQPGDKPEDTRILL